MVVRRQAEEGGRAEAHLGASHCLAGRDCAMRDQTRGGFKRSRCRLRRVDEASA